MFCRCNILPENAASAYLPPCRVETIVTKEGVVEAERPHSWSFPGISFEAGRLVNLRSPALHRVLVFTSASFAWIIKH